MPSLYGIRNLDQGTLSGRRRSNLGHRRRSAPAHTETTNGAADTGQCLPGLEPGVAARGSTSAGLADYIECRLGPDKRGRSVVIS